MNSSFILRGHICYTPEADRLIIRENAYAVCEEGICRGVYDRIPERYAGLETVDCGGKLIIPGMTDLHIHAPQFAYRGTGMDYELLDWLEQAAFPEEILYADTDYAARAYRIFADKLKRSATTRAVVFGTIHTDAALILADLMEESGVISLTGKVNMDRNAPAELTEDTGESAAETVRFIEECLKRGYRRTKPVITPRFVPSCSRELLEKLGRIRAAYGLQVQSHLSENTGEIEWVRELEPEAAFYGDAYDRFGLFGRDGVRTVMAHCVWSVPEEVERIRENGVWIAHCPSSNMNIKSGIAPVRRYLEKGIRVGLGSDVAGGTSESMFRAVTDAIQVSKMYWRHVDPEAKPLTFQEAFWMATKSGGSFFGKAGSFEEGYEFDALVLDDADEPNARPLTAADRLERAFYLGLDRDGIEMKIAGGRVIYGKTERRPRPAG